MRPWYGRTLALVYLIAWPVAVIGVVLVAFFGQWAYAVLVPGADTLPLWAFDLNSRDPEADDALAPRGLKAWQITWYRVVLGAELPRVADLEG